MDGLQPLLDRVSWTCANGKGSTRSVNWKLCVWTTVALPCCTFNNATVNPRYSEHWFSNQRPCPAPQGHEALQGPDDKTCPPIRSQHLTRSIQGLPGGGGGREQEPPMQHFLSSSGVREVTSGGLYVFFFSTEQRDSDSYVWIYHVMNVRIYHLVIWQWEGCIWGNKSFVSVHVSLFCPV